MQWTNGRGAEVILDTVGGATFCRSFRALRLYGRVATLLSTPCDLADVNQARLRNVRVGYVQMTAPSFLNDAEARVAQTRILENAAPLFDDGTHGDSRSHDGVWTNNAIYTVRPLDSSGV